MIAELLESNHASFVKLVENMDEATFLNSSTGKWNAGQQLHHLYKSLRPLAIILCCPPFIIRLVWGTSNRPSRSFDGVVEKYKYKLSAGATATKAFVPQLIPFSEKGTYARKVLATNDIIIKQWLRLANQQADKMVLPHPLLGKLTLREMMYFTIYHVAHHEKQVEVNGAI